MTGAFIAVRRFVREEDGQDLIEYGLLATLIAIVVIGAVTSLGVKINDVLWVPIAQNF